MPLPRKSLLPLAMLMGLLAPLPSLAAPHCNSGIISVIQGKFGPWAMPQKMTLTGHVGRGYCDIDLNILSGVPIPKVVYHTRLQSTKSLLSRANYDVKTSPITGNGMNQLFLYQRYAGADEGASTLKVVSLENGAPLSLLSLSEQDGKLNFQIQNGVVTVTGFRMTKCMACGHMASASWKWDHQINSMALVNPTPASVDFAKYLGGVTFAYGTPLNQVYQNLVSEYRAETQKIGALYDHLLQTDTPQEAAQLKAHEISWIIAKRKACGTSTEALKPGHEVDLECLIRETQSRLTVMPYES